MATPLPTTTTIAGSDGKTRTNGNLKLNLVGLELKDYDGSPSTLCVGCGHNSISNQIVRVAYEMALKPHEVIKLSGIGCSSKSPAYFLNRSHGFNSLHGRMPSIATGACLANHTLRAIAVSGDGDTGSIGIGQFKHLVRRNVPMVYIIENNGVYGLTKGQFSPTADIGQVLKYAGTNEFRPIDLCMEALIVGCGFVARSFAGDAKQVRELLKAALSHRGTAVIEMARASGLTVVGGPEGNDAMAATTTGTGELIDLALDQGAKKIVVCLGGSATTDGGLGCVRAITSPHRLKSVRLLVACDVQTRFVDAARVFAPQKGASPAQVDMLRGRLERLAQMYQEQYGVDVRTIPGSGAAGGLAGGLVALGGRLLPGFDLVADELDLHDRILDANLVVTGEGYLDEQSFEGKVVGVGDGVLRHPEYWSKLRDPFTPSWGEAYAAIAARMLGAIDAARDAARGHEALVVSHQLPVWTARSRLEGRRLWHDPRKRQCALASLTSLHYLGNELVSVVYSEPAATLVRDAAKKAGA